MSTGWDFTVYDRNNQLILVGEAVGKLHASPVWAAQYRRNILVHGTYPNAPFFLMAFPDHFYLWKNIPVSPEPVEPTHTIDAQPILQPYLEGSGLTIDQIYGESLELIVSSWLSILIHEKPEDVRKYEQWKIDSDLHDALYGGRIEYEVYV